MNKKIVRSIQNTTNLRYGHAEGSRLSKADELCPGFY